MSDHDHTWSVSAAQAVILLATANARLALHRSDDVGVGRAHHRDAMRQPTPPQSHCPHESRSRARTMSLPSPPLSLVRGASGAVAFLHVCAPAAISGDLTPACTQERL